MPVPTTNSQQPKRRGAPKGNLNALKNGATSRFIRVLARELLAHQDLATPGEAQAFFGQQLVDVLRAEQAAHRQAKERARQLLEPYQSTRLVDRIAKRLLLAIAEDRNDDSDGGGREKRPRNCIWTDAKK